MRKSKYIILISFLFVSIGATAQKAERDHIRKGNRAFRDSMYVDAEINYRKALEVNPKSTVSMYNLGNTLSQQNKFNEALEQYQAAATSENDKGNLSQVYHNTGVIFQASQDYAKAIEAYKQALRNNPKDDETRYNLALCQKLLKDQEQQQQNQDQNQDQEQEQEQNQDQQNQNQQDQQENQDQQQESQPEQKENEMSKENAEQMLNSVMQDEKEVQEKVQKQQQVIQGGKLEKNW